MEAITALILGILCLVSTLSLSSRSSPGCLARLTVPMTLIINPLCVIVALIKNVGNVYFALVVLAVDVYIWWILIEAFRANPLPTAKTTKGKQDGLVHMLEKIVVTVTRVYLWYLFLIAIHLIR